MIGKHIKPYIFSYVLVIVFIALQALTSLMLPEYMSKIINVGISNRGIDSPVPLAIEKSSLEQLFQDDEPIYLYYHQASLEEIAALEEFTVLPDKEIYVLNDNTDLSEIEHLFTEKFQNEEGAEKSTATQFLLDEYEKLGYNFSKSQNAFILRNGGIMILITLASGIAAVIAGLINSRASAGFGRDLRKSSFRKVLSFSNEEFENFSTASLITRSTNDINQIQQFMAMGLRMMILAPIMGIGAVLKILGTEPYMSRILAGSITATLMLIIVLFVNINPMFKKMQQLTDKINLVVREKLTGLLVIRAFANENAMEERFDEVNKDITGTSKFVGRVMGSMFPLMTIIMNFTSVAIVYFGAGLLERGTIQVGDIMAFIQYGSNVLMSFIFISMFSIMIPRTMVSMGRVKEVLESKTIIKESENPKEVSNSGNGRVSFENISFKYPGADECVLNNISFTANPGEVTALIGTTGSGKSTIINLIPRLYDTTEGEIKIDGVNIKDVKINDLRNKITYAPQKGILFSGTIESNIKFTGNTEISDEVMTAAAQTAQASDFISEKEEGFQTHVAQGGSNLSGGQRQRVSIARALAKPADIFIFDDSFSALDYKTDAKLRQALNKTLAGKTIILVAQRISTIRHANKIIVLDEGNIVSQGTHDELIETCEIYKQLAMSQIS